MDHNPYKPPEAEIEPGGPAPRNTLWWRVFFSLSAIMVGLGILVVPFITGLGPLDIIDFAASIVAMIGVYGFAYYKRIGGVVFWRYFFYFMLLESILFIIVMPLAGANRYGQLTELDGFYIFEIAYAYLVLMALYLYAYRRPFVWSRR